MTIDWSKHNDKTPDGELADKYVAGVMILGIIKMLETLLKSYTTTISQHMAKKNESVKTAKKNKYDDVGWC